MRGSGRLTDRGGCGALRHDILVGGLVSMMGSWLIAIRAERNDGMVAARLIDADFALVERTDRGRWPSGVIATAKFRSQKPSATGSGKQCPRYIVMGLVHRGLDQYASDRTSPGGAGCRLPSH
jgi:hypothetical protein